MKKLILGLFLFAGFQAAAQSGFKWPGGKKSAIVLTYDDALLSQLNVAFPQLSKYGLKGTFFLDGRFKEQDMERWAEVSRNGNELANHSIYHPCSEKAYKANTYSESYTPESMVREIGVINKLLHGIDGAKPRTYAYPCGASLAGGVDYTAQLKSSGFIKYARAGTDRSHAVITDFKNLDFFKVPSWGLAAKTDGAALIQLVKDAQKAGGMAVFMFHGVGGDYIDVSAEAHEELLRYLASTKEVWVGTFQEVLDYVKNNK